MEFFNYELHILHHYWRSEGTIWTHFFVTCLDFIHASPNDAEVNKGFVIQFSGP